MKPQVFKSFEQIEVQLEILSVERALSRHRMDHTIRSMRRPTLAGHVWTLTAPILRNLIGSWILQKIRERKQRKPS